MERSFGVKRSDWRILLICSKRLSIILGRLSKFVGTALWVRKFGPFFGPDLEEKVLEREIWICMLIVSTVSLSLPHDSL